MDRTELNVPKDELIALVLAQGARLAELERRLGLNSGKPPPCDGLAKRVEISSLRMASGKTASG